jgi:hypothetical protein
LTTEVIDPIGVTRDPKMPFLTLALNPKEVKIQFEHNIPPKISKNGKIKIHEICVKRYKPGSRCLIEYKIEGDGSNVSNGVIALIGKAISRGAKKSVFQIHNSLWNRGFNSESEDGVSIPEPIGIIPKFNMWLQRKVPGVVATSLLKETRGITLANRITEAIRKLHRMHVPPNRYHNMAKELSILENRLELVAQIEPKWKKRLERLFYYCEKLGYNTTVPILGGIHRDFYSDQVIVDGWRIYLIDFDMYCVGDPGLDIGNFLGHITEQSVRTLGNPDALMEVEQAMEDRFAELSGQETRPRVRVYKTLTLARHIYISTQFPDRRQFTEKLLELCEQRLSIVEGPHTRKSMHLVSRGEHI